MEFPRATTFHECQLFNLICLYFRIVPEMKPFFTIVALCISLTVSAQFNGFEFGKVSTRELSMKVYDKDTSAAALVLYEFGEAYIDNTGDHNLIFQYHVKIKILKKQGLQYADIQIPLRKQD